MVSQWIFIELPILLTLYTRAEAYGIPGFYCEDGNDVLAVYETMGKAVEHVRGGNGPAIVEVESYRWFGHSTADAGVYRTKEEVDEWKNNNDPIIRYRDYLVSENIASAGRVRCYPKPS